MEGSRRDTPLLDMTAINEASQGELSPQTMALMSRIMWNISDVDWRQAIVGTLVSKADDPEWDE